MKNPRLSIVIPAFREELRIGTTLASLAKYFEEFVTDEIEVLVVDDGSPDNTVDVVRTWQKKMPYLKLIAITENRGKGNAVRTGMLAAKGDYRLFMDADNSVDISHLPEFLGYAEKGFDIVIASISVSGSKVTEQGGSHGRLLGNLAKLPIRLFAVPRISDTQRGFKLFTKKAAEIIFSRQTIERFGFDIEALVIATAYRMKIKELPVEWLNPDGSTVSAGDYRKTFVELIQILKNKYRGIYGGRSREDVKVVPFPKRKQATHGRGFHYNGKEFIHHSDLHHSETALYTLIHSQKLALIFLGGGIAAAFVLNLHLTLIVLLSTLTLLYFFDLLFNAYLIYRSFKSIPEVQVSEDEMNALVEEDLPIYTIFCPLYKEWRVVPQFAAAMEKLDYPKDKLQIMFLLEENDAETIEKIREAALPYHYESVIVPHSSPKTKPKAMNYGLRHVRGDFLVIFDAEDVPEPNQLKKAIVAFRRLPENVVCIQAKLNFYNSHQNLLTKLFTAEYSLWFDLVLPGLQSLNAPIPLGGTSNHFKIEPLRSLSRWGAFNVTEDCDLGLRLANRGYRTAIVESTTYEEANSDLLNWYNQRSRWIKGYIQTYFVHMRSPEIFTSKRTFLDFIYFQLTVGGKILSMFINPLMWLLTITYFVFRPQIGPYIETLFPGPILYIGVFSFFIGNFLYLYYYMIACIKRGHDSLVIYIFFVPFYWLAMSLAAWKAFYEVIVKPHYWAKTIHGLHLDKIAKPSEEGSGLVNV